MIYAATGHRPQHLGGFSSRLQTKLYKIALTFLKNAPDTQKGISGMALGWDQAYAEALIDCHIPLVAAIPFEGFEEEWSRDQKRFYQYLLASATEVEIVSGGGFANWKYQKRNEWMVNQSDKLVALWDSGQSGGTWNCIRYARRKGKPIVNLWDQYAP